MASLLRGGMQYDPTHGIIPYLNANAGAIGVVVTVLGVILAAIYTFYTTRLWRVSLKQALTAQSQAQATQRELQLLEQQVALATKAFETLNRPHLQLGKL